MKKPEWFWYYSPLGQHERHIVVGLFGVTIMVALPRISIHRYKRG